MSKSPSVDELIKEARDKVDCERADRILQYNRYQDRVVSFATAIQEVLNHLRAIVVNEKVRALSNRSKRKRKTK